ncbi:MAG: hypothetical protein ABIF77_09200 [bacterium]
MPNALFIMLVSLLLATGCGDENNPTDPSDPGDNNPWVPDTTATGLIVAGHDAVPEFDQIPDTVFQYIRDTFRIYYGHTSHGSQIVSGLNMLAAAKDPDYSLPDLHEPGGDLGHNGDLTWYHTTRSYLDAHPGQYNVVMWSWCGGCSDNTANGIQIYLDAMNQLETDYPGITFVYMTGHLDGDGPGGILYASNHQIRQYCQDNDKVLFDFADIESYDPAGNYYPDESDGCGWCATWCAQHTCPTCASCAHSHCFNCYLKGKVFWWMMARVVGWENSSGLKTWSPLRTYYD